MTALKSVNDQLRSGRKAMCGRPEAMCGEQEPMLANNRWMNRTNDAEYSDHDP
jgi:hypothetical protein